MRCHLRTTQRIGDRALAYVCSDRATRHTQSNRTCRVSTLQPSYTVSIDLLTTTIGAIRRITSYCQGGSSQRQATVGLSNRVILNVSGGANRGSQRIRLLTLAHVGRSRITTNGQTDGACRIRTSQTTHRVGVGLLSAVIDRAGRVTRHIQGGSSQRQATVGCCKRVICRRDAVDETILNGPRTHVCCIGTSTNR